MKNVFVIIVTYQKPMDEVEKHLEAHRAFLADGYKSGTLMMSGGQNPRIGGVIVGRFGSKDEANEFISKDPFFAHSVAKYELTEFVPSKYADEIKDYIAAD